MKKCAIILNGSDVVKVSNLKRKYNKFVNNPDIKILEECDEDQLDEKYDYWCRTINYKTPEVEEENPQTLDDISSSIIMGTISLIGLVGAIIYLRRNKERVN